MKNKKLWLVGMLVSMSAFAQFYLVLGSPNEKAATNFPLAHVKVTENGHVESAESISDTGDAVWWLDLYRESRRLIALTEKCRLISGAA